MPRVAIQLADQRTAFAPRETVTGRVSWELDSPPQSAELRLIWTASSRALADGDLVQTIPFPDPQATETRPFTLTLPEAPYSFSGALITLTWTLELEVQPDTHSDSVAITMAPGGQPISLPRLKPA